MRPKLNLKDKGQISKPNEYTDNFKSNLTCIFLSVRAKLKKTLCPRTLCRLNKKLFDGFEELPFAIPNQLYHRKTMSLISN